MNKQQCISDNVTEILAMIIEFTQRRQKFLIRNIKKMSNPDFVPMDLNDDEFSDLLAFALDEHIKSGCLVLYDGTHTRFGRGGDFDVKPLVDKYSQKLLKKSTDKYLKPQINKIFENTYNQKLALQLFNQKQGTVTPYEDRY